MSPMISLVLLALAIYFAFKINIFFGIAFLVAAIFYFYHKNRGTVLANKAENSYKAGDTETAILFFREAAALSKKNTAMNAGYAHMLLRCGKPEEALSQINKFLSDLSLNPELRKQARQIRALINYKLKNFDEAYEEGLELYEMGNTTSSMRGLLGLLMLGAEKDFEKTIKFCEDAYEYDSDNRDIVDNYLLALINAKDYTKAQEISEKLLALAPDFPESYYHSAILYKHMGNTKRSAELIAKLETLTLKYMTTFTEEDVKILKASL